MQDYLKKKGLNIQQQYIILAIVILAYNCTGPGVQC